GCVPYTQVPDVVGPCRNQSAGKQTEEFFKGIFHFLFKSLYHLLKVIFRDEFCFFCIVVQGLGVSLEKIIYANPYKQMSQIKYAASNGVQMMTFDSEVELMKVARAHPKAKLVLWIATDESKAVCHLSIKFGDTLKTSRLLLEWTKELNIDVVGVSFNVGSGCSDPETFVQALSDACCAFDMGTEVGFSMYLLDIGGGFPGSEDTKLKV
ncbi:hypothetical protein STEG23_012677, partial [Scotinomys teguina]